MISVHGLADQLLEEVLLFGRPWKEGLSPSKTSSLNFIGSPPELLNRKRVMRKETETRTTKMKMKASISVPRGSPSETP